MALYYSGCLQVAGDCIERSADRGLWGDGDRHPQTADRLPQGSYKVTKFTYIHHTITSLLKAHFIFQKANLTEI